MSRLVQEMPVTPVDWTVAESQSACCLIATGAIRLRSCPARRHLLLEISVTSVGVEERKLLPNHANETVEHFHQRVTLLFTSLAVGVVAALLLEQFGGGLNLRPLQLNQVAQRKRLRGHRQNQRSSGSNRLHHETLRGR